MWLLNRIHLISLSRTVCSYNSAPDMGLPELVFGVWFYHNMGVTKNHSELLKLMLKEYFRQFTNMSEVSHCTTHLAWREEEMTQNKMADVAPQSCKEEEEEVPGRG